MKKILGILAIVLLISSCDDGDIVLESFNFSSATIQKCTDKQVLFKINGDELLLVDIPATYFLNEITPVDQPRIATISGTNKVLYRKYSGTVSNTTICSVIPPASPAVTKEWTAASGGTIQINTTEKTSLDPITNLPIVTGYNHQIKFLNIQFTSSDNEFVFEEYLFGTYTTNL